jgi:CDP-glycerol glycerophosphotransferase
MSYGGKQYSCNPKYIYECLKNDNRYDCIWCLPKDYITNKNIKRFNKSNWLLYVWHNLTAKMIITNDLPMPIIPYHKNQIIIHTGHGGGSYKKCGQEMFGSYFIKKDVKYAGGKITYSIASCKASLKDFTNAYGVNSDHILNFGMPRSDILFSNDLNIIKKVYSHYNISDSMSIVLYAPTYRGKVTKSKSMNIDDLDKLLSELDEKFKRKHVFMIRTHHSVKDKFSEAALNGNSYDDIQELICAADILITDYSSLIWDFCIIKKPFFLYLPDLQKYESDRGFTVPIEKWGFPFAESFDELLLNIRNFDMAQHIASILYHTRMLGSYENGVATKLCVDFINNLMIKC